jgi:hypothetical protein
LIDWPQTGDETVQFQLPGKPQYTELRFGMNLDAVHEEDLGQCALRTSEDSQTPRYPPLRNPHRRRHLVFLATMDRSMIWKPRSPVRQRPMASS